MKTIGIICFLLFFASPDDNTVVDDKVVIIDWTTRTFSSKYGNPITYQYMLVRGQKRVDYMNNRYHYYFRTRSCTKYKKKNEKVWIGFDVNLMTGEVPYKDKDGDAVDLEYGSTLSWDKYYSWDFWATPATLNLEFEGERGWIGTFLNEMEKED
jgi:hypothetical protein